MGTESRVYVVMTTLSLICIFVSTSVRASTGYREPTGNSIDTRKELDGAYRSTSSSLDQSQSPGAERSPEVAVIPGRGRRSPSASVGDVGDQRRAITVVTRHQQQQQQQVPNAGQQSQQPTMPKSAWQNRERSRQAHLFLIQTRIMNTLRLTSRPNVTGRTHNITEEEIAARIEQGQREEAARSRGRSEDVGGVRGGRRPHGVRHQTTVVRQVTSNRRPSSQQQGRGDRPPTSTSHTFVLLPTCTVPSRLKGTRFFTPNRGANVEKSPALRLYFNTDALAISGTPRENNRKIRGGSGVKALRIDGADLHLYWRGQSDKKKKHRSRVEAAPYANKTTADTVVGKRSSNSSADGMSGRARRKRPDPGATDVASSGAGSVRGVRGIRGVRGGRYRRGADLHDKEASTVQIAVYRLSSSTTGGARRRINRDDDVDVVSTPIKAVTLKDLTKSRWIKFNVTSAVDEWIKNPNKNYGLQVVVTGGHVTTDRRGNDRSRRRRPAQHPGLDGYHCGDQNDRSTSVASVEDDRQSNVSVNGSRLRTPSLDPDDLDKYHGGRAMSDTAYPKLEVSVVRTSLPDATPSGDRRRNRGGRRTNRRRNRRDDSGVVNATSSLCQLAHVDFSMQGFTWKNVTIVHASSQRIALCISLNSCQETTSLRQPEADECCESVERDPVLVTYLDRETGVKSTLPMPNTNVVECRLRRVGT